MADMKFEELSSKMISCAIDVHRGLGPGLLESSYEQCLAHELTLAGVALCALSQLWHTVSVELCAISVELRVKQHHHLSISSPHTHLLSTRSISFADSLLSKNYKKSEVRGVVILKFRMRGSLESRYQINSLISGVA